MREATWVSPCHCRARLGVAGWRVPGYVSHHMCAIVWEKRSMVGTRLSAFAVAEDELLNLRTAVRGGMSPGFRGGYL